MGTNASTSFLPAYNNCFSDDLSRDSFTPEYWDSHSINESFKISSIFTGVVLLLFLVVGLPSNLIVIYGIIRQRLYKEPTHMLLLNLAISDFLICLLVMPLTIIASFSGSYIFGDSDHIRCRVCQTGFIYTWLTLVSVYMLGLLSIDRFIYIKLAMYYNKYVTAIRMLLASIVVWVASLIISLLPIMGFGEIRYAYSISACIINFGTPENVNYVIFMVLYSSLPAIMILVCNIWIIFIVIKHIKQVYKTSHIDSKYHQTLKKSIKKTKNHKQLVLLRTFGAIIITNIAVWFPLIFLTFSSAIIDGNLIPGGVFALSYILNVLHVVLHPIIEGCLIPDIRQMIKKVFISLLCRYPACERIFEFILGSTSESGEDGSDSSAKPSCTCCCDSCYVWCSAVLPDDPTKDADYTE